MMMLMTENPAAVLAYSVVLRLRPILSPFFRGKGPLIRVLFTSFVLQELDPWMPIMKGHEAQL